MFFLDWEERSMSQSAGSDEGALHLDAAKALGLGAKPARVSVWRKLLAANKWYTPLPLSRALSLPRVCLLRRSLSLS